MVGIGFLGKKICYKRPTFVKERAVPIGIALFFFCIAYFKMRK